MACTCGAESKGVSVIVGIVRVRTAHCTECGKILREYSFVKPYTKHGLTELLIRLHQINSRINNETRKLVIDFIERTLDSMTYDKDSDEARRKRRNDYLERKLLKELLGDDYYT